MLKHELQANLILENFYKCGHCPVVDVIYDWQLVEF